MARPTKYKPEYCQTIIDLMKEGASIEEICLDLDICVQTIYNWCETKPEFLEAKKRGTDFSKGWWMKQGRTNLFSKDFNYTGWYMNMKNRFGWADKQETDLTSKGEKIEFNLIDGTKS
jgi:transposase